MSVYDLIKNTNIITIGQGSDYSDTVTILQAIGGPPVDLTGYTAASQVNTLDGALAAVMACTIPNPVAGVVERSIAKADTGKLLPCTNIQHVHGLQLTTPGGVALPEIQGGAVVTPEIVA